MYIDFRKQSKLAQVLVLIAFVSLVCIAVYMSFFMNTDVVKYLPAASFVGRDSKVRTIAIREVMSLKIDIPEYYLAGQRVVPGNLERQKEIDDLTPWVPEIKTDNFRPKVSQGLVRIDPDKPASLTLTLRLPSGRIMGTPGVDGALCEKETGLNLEIRGRFGEGDLKLPPPKVVVAIGDLVTTDNSPQGPFHHGHYLQAYKIDLLEEVVTKNNNNYEFMEIAEPVNVTITWPEGGIGEDMFVGEAVLRFKLGAGDRNK